MQNSLYISPREGLTLHDQFLNVFLVLAGKSVITAIVRGFRAVVAQSELLWIHSVPQMALKED